MTIKERNQNFMQQYHHLLMPLLIAALGYFGVDIYPEVAERISGGGGVTVKINQEAPKVPTTVVNTGGSSGPSQIEIQVLIDNALAAHQASKQFHEF